jgi:acyl-CoA hydrolase
MPITCSAAEAVAHIGSGQQIFVHGGAAAPTLLLEALAARAATLTDVGILHLHCEGPAPHVAPALAGHLRHHALFIGANTRQAVNEGRADYIPVFLSDVPRLFERRIIPIDVAFLHVSPPDHHGYCSLGPSVDVTMAAANAASLLIAQVDSRLPRTHGDGAIAFDDLDFVVEHESGAHIVAPAVLSDVERRIGQHVADLIPNGATLQLGIGGLPAAVCAALGDKRELGVHTEMFTDGVVDLVERGIITGSAKEIDRGRIVASFVVGSERLYRFLDDNPQVQLRTANYTNDPEIIRRFRHMIAVNSAIEIDLTGQVCADSIGPRLYSGVGGQVDFLRGAALAEDGRAILALPATALGGTRSRLVATLQPGAGVVTTRAHVHTVVTEHGVAELHGRSLAQRARALIAIAAPPFRDALAAQARQAHLL